ncbi:pimeloyl-ACP methyl ester esterase BioH [Pseudidiomarina mangrovi]|uniref:pimeloyl-ACP methyl ester esterase BioH n=1 Tax=Pseudidiomarina mangrovi TaxID=2487133 RepID=UPI000FC996DE|nr:pimeloyl-ACP methyl ester esterase BioH [Pseudidiomarina mangrovi]CAI8160782.1 MAG: Pimeloyl-[acyl-carrier protein] methyl ester esterase [Pseudidiomarina mangrovi]
MVTPVWQSVSGAGTDLVVLHGWGLNASIWQAVAAPLQAHRRLHCIDLPGYGESPWPSAVPISFDQLVELTAAALPARCQLLGWSLGGLVATAIALRYPERVSQLITVASSPYFPAADQWPGIDPHILNTFARQLSADFKRTVERFLALQSLGSQSAKADVKQIKEWLFSKPMAKPEVLDAGLDMLSSVDLRAELARLSMPMLRIYGRLDSLVPAAVVPYVDQLAPTSKAIILPHCSHAPFVNEPEVFCQALLDHTPS